MKTVFALVRDIRLAADEHMTIQKEWLHPRWNYFQSTQNINTSVLNMLLSVVWKPWKWLTLNGNIIYFSVNQALKVTSLFKCTFKRMTPQNVHLFITPNEIYCFASCLPIRCVSMVEWFLRSKKIVISPWNSDIKQK